VKLGSVSVSSKLLLKEYFQTDEIVINEAVYQCTYAGDTQVQRKVVSQGKLY